MNIIWLTYLAFFLNDDLEIFYKLYDDLNKDFGNWIKNS
ncbi:hypothetical protein LCGC14_2714940, partial [marine sediment metagenome]